MKTGTFIYIDGKLTKYTKCFECGKKRKHYENGLCQICTLKHMKAYKDKTDSEIIKMIRRYNIYHMYK